ncbi:MAG TPA: hypothetical protein VE442_20780 [Jatrophihabitans sp.]|nr:hypothetical protein [Jatrophihabitans sp.]
MLAIAAIGLALVARRLATITELGRGTLFALACTPVGVNVAHVLVTGQIRETTAVMLSSGRICSPTRRAPIAC